MKLRKLLPLLLLILSCQDPEVIKVKVPVKVENDCDQVLNVSFPDQVGTVRKAHEDTISYFTTFRFFMYAGEAASAVSVVRSITVWREGESGERSVVGTGRGIVVDEDGEPVDVMVPGEIYAYFSEYDRPFFWHNTFYSNSFSAVEEEAQAKVGYSRRIDGTKRLR